VLQHEQGLRGSRNRFRGGGATLVRRYDRAHVVPTRTMHTPLTLALTLALPVESDSDTAHGVR